MIVKDLELHFEVKYDYEINDRQVLENIAR